MSDGRSAVERTRDAHDRDQRRGLWVLLALFSGIAATAATFPPRALMYPLFVGMVGALLAALELGLTARRSKRARDVLPASPFPHGSGSVDDPTLAAAFRRIVRYVAWLGGFLALTALVGFVAASGVFVASFLRREASADARFAAVSFVAVCGILLAAGAVLGLRWPASVFDPFRTMGLL